MARLPLSTQRLKDSSSRRRYIGTKIMVLESTPSTNDECHRLAEAGEASGHAVVAETQSQGRGRHGSVWTAPPMSSLLFSVLLRPPPHLDQPSLLTAWSAVSIVDAIEECFSLDAKIKWPNDVLIDGRKACGILVERRRATVVGIGVNVSNAPEEFPETPRIPAISLEAALEAEIDRTDLLLALLDRMDAHWSQLSDAGAAPLLRRWEQVSQFRPGDQVEAETLDGKSVGCLLRLRPDIGAKIADNQQNVIEIAPERLCRLAASPSPSVEPFKPIDGVDGI